MILKRSLKIQKVGCHDETAKIFEYVLDRLIDSQKIMENMWLTLHGPSLHLNIIYKKIIKMNQVPFIAKEVASLTKSVHWSNQGNNDIQSLTRIE